ncbi:enoyl-CoA delta isomerase 2 [Leptidea sinapis]|uniref:enoyl-CoA delta isomerase 2 n=1 Tax=Leptidea sinapis TaxID=189913 RepID=UPI00212FC7B5|nr:enoyl-CoA delta isomerase 2 [Leptidea sinapis]
MQTIVESTKDNIKIIRFNKPKKKNALDCDMYFQISSILHKAATDEDIIMVVLSGIGDFYSSGNDFSSATNNKEELRDVLIKLIQAFVLFPKLLVAIVQGGAIGIAATTLPLCDFVFASSDAFFSTPFTKLGIVAEGGSSLTFPQIMGHRKARQMLMLNYKMKAQEALECGLISHVYDPKELEDRAWENIYEILKLPHDSLIATKKLLQKPHLDQLLSTCQLEIEELYNIGKSKL